MSQETPTQRLDVIQDRKRKRVDELYAAVATRPRVEYGHSAGESSHSVAGPSRARDQNDHNSALPPHTAISTDRVAEPVRSHEHFRGHGIESDEYVLTHQDIEDLNWDETCRRNNIPSENTEFNDLNIHDLDPITPQQPDIFIREIRAAHTRRIRTYGIFNNHIKEIKTFFEKSMVLFIDKMTEQLLIHPMMKINTLITCDFKKIEIERVIIEPKYFQTRAEVLGVTDNLGEWFLENVIAKHLMYLEEFQEQGSGWALDKICSLELRLNKYSPLNGGSFIDLPKQIKNKRACLNVMNRDNQCFQYAVLAGLYYNPEHDGKRHSKPNRPNNNTIVEYYRSYLNKLDMTGISYPVRICEIKKFEKQNLGVEVNGVVSDISVNVYMLKLNENRNFIVSPIHISKQRTSESHHVNLLLHHDESLYQTEVDELKAISRDSSAGNSNIHYHFSYIKNMSALVSKQISNHNGAKLICDRCINHFGDESVFKAHIKRCKSMQNETAVRLPLEKEKILKFKNIKNKKMKPFVIYADTETMLEKVVNNEDDDHTRTRKIQKHVAYG